MAPDGRLIGLCYDRWTDMVRRQLVELGHHVAVARRAMIAASGSLLHRAYIEGVSSDEMAREIANKISKGDR